MAYLLAELLKPYISVFNLFTYHTVRAGGAAFMGFLFCVLMGPYIIQRLKALKVGQFIRRDYVEDLHELHKGKSGTPTMGGLMIILATLLSLLVWGRFSNRMLWVALAVMGAMGAVGILDDILKLRRRHNTGLSARAKFTGQIITGLALGIYLVNNPITVSASYVYPRDVINWEALEDGLVAADESQDGGAAARIWERFPEEARNVVREARENNRIAEKDQRAVLLGLNNTLRDRTLYEAALWPEAAMKPELTSLLQRGLGALQEREVVRVNRLLLEMTFPQAIAESMPNLHTKLGLPGFKQVFIPLGMFYILFVVLVIVSITNAVNLTDGLDGLAAGISIIAILAYAGIAYIISRADWSQYLFLTYVPEASELFVFGAAVLGAGLGFLWFNGHPAEVFMGDTGSLALGGAIGTMALLTKQELLLPVVAGMFVLETLSVVIQVGSYKLTGKRVFRMAPLHHHFELTGWTETKVTMRFWILALLFALLSLSALKLR